MKIRNSHSLISMCSMRRSGWSHSTFTYREQRFVLIDQDQFDSSHDSNVIFDALFDRSYTLAKSLRSAHVSVACARDVLQLFLGKPSGFGNGLPH